MTVSNSELQELYDALLRAIASGVTKVKYGDKEVQYQSADDMKKALTILEAKLGSADRRMPQRITSTFTKGTK